jgi:D-alanine--poly(phosphoribitol) ligase subunit 2
VLSFDFGETKKVFRIRPMQKKLREFIFRELVCVADPEHFGERDDLLEAGLDSMATMRLVIFIENEFSVTLPDAEIEPDNVRSLAALERWISSHRKG